jgi:protein ImuB
MLLCVSVSNPSPDWAALLDALDAVSPVVEDARPGLAFLEMRGIDGTPAAWMAHVRAIAQTLGITVRVGTGATRIAARGAAHVADGTAWIAGSERAQLAPLPLTLLDLEPEIVERLRLLGVDRLGALARLPHGPFVRRFGRAAARWHAEACGRDVAPLVPRGHAIALGASLFGEGHVEDEAQVFFALRLLLSRICGDLDRSGKRTGLLALDIELEDGATQVFEVPLALPTAHERSLFDVLRAKLEGATFPAAIVGLRLRALRLEEGGESKALFAADDIDPQTVAVTLARLEAAVGAAVQRARTRDAHALENRFAYSAFEAPKSELLAAAAPAFPPELVPQLRLVPTSEVAVRTRAGAPAFVDAKAVLECAGPWRVDEGWFGAPVVRDEYDVVLADGGYHRIYREGERWYLRGSYD